MIKRLSILAFIGFLGFTVSNCSNNFGLGTGSGSDTIWRGHHDTIAVPDTIFVSDSVQSPIDTFGFSDTIGGRRLVHHDRH